MTEYIIAIPGELRGKQRPRVTRKGHAYTPQETTNAEAWVKACAIDAGVVYPLEGPLSLRLVVARAVPESWSKKKRAAALAGAVRATGKPDLDNIVKLVGDALNGIAWKDDSQIVDLSVARVFGERAASELVVRQL